MPRHRFTDDEFDPEELDVEYDKSQGKYRGPIPDTGTMLLTRCTKMWLTKSGNNDVMFKALLVAEDGEDQEEDVSEFDGCPVWENLTMIPSAAFKYQPFIEAYPFTLHDMKNKLIVDKEEDNIGKPVQKIGTWEPGSDDALAFVVVQKERYNGEWQAKIGDIIPFEEEEEEEPEPPPKRGRKTAKAAPKSRRRAEPESEDEDDEFDDEDEFEDEEEEAPPPRRTRARANGGRSRSRKAATAGSRRGRKSSDEDEDEPPF